MWSEGNRERLLVWWEEPGGTHTVEPREAGSVISNLGSLPPTSCLRGTLDQPKEEAKPQGESPSSALVSVV